MPALGSSLMRRSGSGHRLSKVVQSSTCIPLVITFVLTTGAGRITARRVILASGADTLRLQQPEGLFARSINLTSFIDDIAGAPEICLIDEVSKGYIRPGCRRSYFVGGAIQKDATVPEELKVDNAAADAQNLAFPDVFFGRGPIARSLRIPDTTPIRPISCRSSDCLLKRAEQDCLLAFPGGEQSTSRPWPAASPQAFRGVSDDADDCLRRLP
nr:hypothetical protein [Saliniramus fredricksonii]